MAASNPATQRRIEPTFAELFTPKLVTILREGYGLKDLRADAIAGLTVAIVALPLSMAIHRPRSKRSTRCAREISGWAIRTSARRSRPTTTSLPGEKVREEPPYLTVSAGVSGRLIGNNCIGWL